MDTLFDLDTYHAPPAQISEDGDGDHEDPRYITPQTFGRDGGKTKVLRFLHSETMDGSTAIGYVALRNQLPVERVQGLALTDGHLFETELQGQTWALKLTEEGKKVAKLVIDHLPKDAELIDEHLGFKYIRLEWTAYGGMQSQTFKLTEKKRSYGVGWCSLESRTVKDRYEQFYLHYQFPSEPKRSKYVSRSQVAKIKSMISEKLPLPDILQAINDKNKPL